MVLEKVADLPYGENPHQRAAFYRETTHRSGTISRRHPAPGRAADLQQPPRPRRRLPDRGGLHGADRRDRQAHGPGRRRVERGAGRGLPARARHRPGLVVRRHRRRQPRARRRDRARDRRQLVRGGHRARVLAGRARDPRAQAGPGAPRRPRLADRGHARLRHRQPRLQARRRRPAGRGARRRRPRPRPAPGRDPAPPDAGRADGPPVRLARGAPRPLERDRARPERRHGRDRCRAGEPERRRWTSPSAGPATAPSSR